jgi:CHAT domain-containing protein
VVTHADFGPGGGPLVFVNACQTGQGGGAIDGMAGFADAFLSPKSRRGAAAFIGALWSINDTLANVFADAVYRRLNEGDSLAKAVQAARTECQTKKDFTWLAYTVYGAL